MDNMTQHAAWKFINLMEHLVTHRTCGAVSAITFLGKYPCALKYGHKGLHTSLVFLAGGKSMSIHFMTKDGQHD